MECVRYVPETLDMLQIQSKNRALAEAQAAASPAAEQARTVVLACAEHQALKEQADQMQVYRQNNTLLRCAPPPPRREYF